MRPSRPGDGLWIGFGILGSVAGGFLAVGAAGGLLTGLVADGWSVVFFVGFLSLGLGLAGWSFSAAAAHLQGADRARWDRTWRLRTASVPAVLPE